MMFKKLLWLLLLTCSAIFAETDVEKLESLKEKISLVDESIKDNLWLKRYGSYLSYQKLIEELSTVDAEVKKFRPTKDKALLEKQEKFLSKQQSLEKQLLLLQEFKNSPFSKLVEPTEIENYPKVTNPLNIISALSYINGIKQDSNEYKLKIEELNILVNKLKEKLIALEEIRLIEPTSANEEIIRAVQKDINAFTSAQEVASTSYSLHVKKVEEATIRITQDITLQVKRALNIGIFIAIVIVFTLLLKFVAKRYIKDDERFYTANKIINFINATLIVLILLFSYIENVSYLVTVVGFASAGIAIAMKDWFMSILGWTVIIFGGSFHVGDRIKVQKDGLLYVGDIIDISLLRITLFEDVTISTYKENRRAGRVIFVPNNYIFTSLVSNYTHSTLRTVWDGIDIYITFDSNHRKAVHLAREIVKKYSKGYTDIARKQFNLLRHQYNLKNVNVEPRIFSFVEADGFCISSWYMTNSYATLTLRSTIGTEIIDAFLKEEDITITYPTQNVNFHSSRKPPHLDTASEPM